MKKQKAINQAFLNFHEKNYSRSQQVLARAVPS